MGQSVLRDGRAPFRRDGRWPPLPSADRKGVGFRSPNPEWRRWAPRGVQCGNATDPGEAGGSPGSEDGSVEDGWRKMGLGGSPALAAGPGRGGPLWGWPGPVGVPGVSRDRPRVWVAVGPRAGFPGGPAVFPVSLWSPDGARGPVPRPPPCVLAGPSPPLPASPPRPARATAPRSLPLSGAEPASPHVGVVPRPPSAGGVPEAGRRAGSFARVGDVGAAGARRESVLPGRLAALGCVSVAVGVSPREGAGGGGASPSSRACGGTVPVLGGLRR
uniref:Uncharacterized protein n=1 Tax=Bos indicus x Bos taurus TaxID=30522 RepID=A0A4W2EAL1_BOBOX